MKITKKDTYGSIDSNIDPDDIKFCPYCYRANGDKFPLEPRSNYNLPDKELWSQCPNCRRVLPASSGTKTSQLRGEVDPIDSVFDKREITGLGNKKPRNLMTKYKKQLLDKANKETDAEIRREILKGNIIEEGLNHEER